MRWNKTLLTATLAVLACAAITTATLVGQEKTQTTTPAVSQEKTQPAAPAVEPPGPTYAQVLEREKAAIDALKGTWLVKKSLAGGKEQDKYFEYFQWQFDGYNVKYEQKKLDGTVASGEYGVTVNPTTDPPEMNIHGKDMLLLALYRQDGDKMRIAMLSRPEFARARSFDPKDVWIQGLGLRVWELTRRK